MKKTLLILTAFLSISSILLGQESMYMQDANGLLHGPYELRTGATYQVDFKAPTMVHPSKQKIEFQKKLEKTVIPQISFTQQSIREAVNILQNISGTNVPVELPQGEVPIILDLSDYTDDPFAPETEIRELPLITFNERKISFLEAIKMFAKAAVLDFQIDDTSIKMYPMYRKRTLKNDVNDSNKPQADHPEKQ